MREKIREILDESFAKLIKVLRTEENVEVAITKSQEIENETLSALLAELPNLVECDKKQLKELLAQRYGMETEELVSHLITHKSIWLKIGEGK